MNTKKLQCMLKSIQNTIDAIMLEIEELPGAKEVSENVIPIQELVSRMHQDDITEHFEGVEEPDTAQGILIGGEKERTFYERFNLGD